MSSTRVTLIQALTEKFKNPILKSTILTEGQNALKNGLATRVFDKFPALLPQVEIEALRTDFVSNLKAVKFIQMNDDGASFEKHKDTQAFTTWTNKIIQRACTELLDKTGRIKKELIQLLEWKNLINSNSQKQTCDIMCAYVGAIIQEVVKPISHTLEENNEAAMAVYHFFNKRIREKVIDALDEAKLIFDPAFDTKKERSIILSFFNKIPKPSKSFCAVVTGFFVAATVATVMLMKNSDDAKPDDISFKGAKPG